MGLLSSLRKNKKETAPTGVYQTRAEDDSDSMRKSRAKRGSAKERNKADDPVLPEKKRARRRLVGAVALVLAAVIGLPMILDSEPKPVADDIAIDIPSKDKHVKAGQVPASPATPPAAAAKPPAAAALDKDEEVIDPATLPAQTPPAPSTASKSEMPQLVKPEPKPEARAEAKAPKAEPKPEKRADAERSAKAEKAEGAERKAEAAHAKPAHADKMDELARANAILDGRPEPKAETKEAKHDAEHKAGGSRFVVQVAALATQDKVDELQDKLRSAGISSYTQKVSTGSGSRTRVRVGPFSSKEEADRVRAKLGKLGLNGTLVPA
jgi:DedD protein